MNPRDDVFKAERKSILLALLAAVSSCVVAYGRPLPSAGGGTLRAEVVRMRVLRDAGVGEISKSANVQISNLENPQIL